MASITATHAHPEAPLFSDGLGERTITADPSTGELLQILHLRPGLTAVPSFEFALRERAARLANFRHASYARVRRTDRTPLPVPGLAVVSDHIEGTRLSELLRVAHERRLPLETNAAIYLVQQLVPAVALLHENARDAAHGLLAPERLVVTPQGRLVVVEHVLGAAIEQLQYGRDRLWQEFRIAMPATAGLPRFDHRADVAGIGMVMLALMLGRPLARDEYPYQAAALIGETCARIGGTVQPLSAALRNWIARALQLDLRRGFASVSEAAAALEVALATEPQYVAAPVALETFLSHYASALLEPADAPAPSDLRGPDPPELGELIDLSEFVPEAERPEPLPVEPVVKPLFDPDAPFSAPDPVPQAEAAARRAPVRLIAAAAVLLVLLGGGAFAAATYFGGAEPSPALGTLLVESNPAGVPVFVNGVDRGVTPARIMLAPGSHILELRRGVPRVVPFTIEAGSQVRQYLEFVETPLLGQLFVQSDPAGAKVFVDGVERGVAPVHLDDLAPGPHEVVLQTDVATARHQVLVQAGGTASLVVPVASGGAGPVSGWVAVKAPFRLDILEQGRLLGTNDAERLMMTAGRHELELVNESLGYRVTRVIQVPAGRTAVIELELPRGVVHLNATPWAEVFIGGERVGETPIGNLRVPIGAHEVVFKHPQFGEKRHAMSVTLGAPVRVSVDMKQ